MRSGVPGTGNHRLQTTRYPPLLTKEIRPTLGTQHIKTEEPNSDATMWQKVYRKGTSKPRPPRDSDLRTQLFR